MDRRTFLLATAALANTPHALLARDTRTHVSQKAKAARVKTLVLSHLIPAEDPLITDSVWIDAARKTFAGRIVVGRDLMEV